MKIIKTKIIFLPICVFIASLSSLFGDCQSQITLKDLGLKTVSSMEAHDRATSHFYEDFTYAWLIVNKALSPWDPSADQAIAIAQDFINKNEKLHEQLDAMILGSSRDNADFNTLRMSRSFGEQMALARFDKDKNSPGSLLKEMEEINQKPSSYKDFGFIIDNFLNAKAGCELKR